jgi:hypothetical protein
LVVVGINCIVEFFGQFGNFSIGFQIQVAAPLTSTHRFRLRLDYDDGSGLVKPLTGPWIEASLFVENEIR